MQLSELLRHPEDLDRLPGLKGEFTRKKATIDAQLKLGLQEQLALTQNGLTSVSDGQRTVNLIKDEMMKIDKLCAEAQNMIRDFPHINLVAMTHRNFSQVEEMRESIETFDEKISELETLLSRDEQELENQPNLLSIHYGLTKLRDVRDEAMEQIRRADDASLEETLQTYFTKLDEVVEWFDEHVGTACMNLIPLVQQDNSGMVVRLAVIIEEEERHDKKVKALQDAKKDHKELASRFKSINTGPNQLRGYKEKFMQAIEMYAQAQFEKTAESFLEDPDKLEKNFRWFFNDLNVVKLGMQTLMPKKWKIFRTYTEIYHKGMHDWLINFIDDPDLPPANMLSIVHWTEKYYSKMGKLGWKASDLQPQVLDDREGDLVREFRQLIVKSVDEWMDRMFEADQKSFLEKESGTLDNDEHGYFRTKTLADMWRMLREQVLVAGNSDRADVTEGVVDAMFRALKLRQTTWEKLIDDEANKYKLPASESDGLQVLQDWLIAIANDQISCIDDNEETNQFGYLTRFKKDFETLVTPKYVVNANTEMDALRDGYVDLGTHCISTFVSMIFSVDFRSIMTEFFTAKWYSEYSMRRITSTFDDYIGDYANTDPNSGYTGVLHQSLVDILVEELADELLVRYLSSVRNKGVKFRRSDAFAEKFRDDVVTAFAFFEKFPETALHLKEKWRVVNYMVRMLEADKSAVASVYEEFKRGYWDISLPWVESVLRARDDFDRSMLKEIKAKAAEVYVERGPETIMSKVR